MSNIEYDRRSGVSSFYGGRRSSVDMLNSDVPMRDGPSRGQRPRRGGAERDDASSFFSPDMQPQNAGYNTASFFDTGRIAPVKGGRDEEEAAFIGGAQTQNNAGWDVFADFNNTGPRYSTAFVKQDEGYQRLPPQAPSAPSIHKYEEDTSTGPVEMVTVPALGAEWKKSELKAMTKAGKKERDEEFRSERWKRWWRDQGGLCGPFGTRKQLAIIFFVLAAVIATVLAITLPRVPGFAFASSSPLTNSTNSPKPVFSRAPANFSFFANLDLQVDTGSNFLPLKFTHLKTELFDLDTDNLVATGDLPGKTVPAKKFTEVFVPLNFTYVALNDSDPTWNNWYNACKNTALFANGSRPGVDFRIEVTMNIAGLIGSRQAATQVSNVACPFELPQNAV